MQKIVEWVKILFQHSKPNAQIILKYKSTVLICVHFIITQLICRLRSFINKRTRQVKTNIMLQWLVLRSLYS